MTRSILSVTMKRHVDTVMKSVNAESHVSMERSLLIMRPLTQTRRIPLSFALLVTSCITMVLAIGGAYIRGWLLSSMASYTVYLNIAACVVATVLWSLWRQANTHAMSAPEMPGAYRVRTLAALRTCERLVRAVRSPAEIRALLETQGVSTSRTACVVLLGPVQVPLCESGPNFGCIECKRRGPILHYLVAMPVFIISLAVALLFVTDSRESWLARTTIVGCSVLAGISLHSVIAVHLSAIQVITIRDGIIGVSPRGTRSYTSDTRWYPMTGGTLIVIRGHGSSRKFVFSRGEHVDIVSLAGVKNWKYVEAQLWRAIVTPATSTS